LLFFAPPTRRLGLDALQGPRHRAIAERDEDLVAVDCESMLDGDVQGSIDAAAVRDVVQVLRGPVGVQGRMETDDVRLSERANGVSVEIDCAGDPARVV